jgi:hypothetical protein
MIFNEELTSEERFHRGAIANTPHLNPLPYTTTASRGLGSPQGERRGKKRFMVNLQNTAIALAYGGSLRKDATKVGLGMADICFYETNPIYFDGKNVVSDCVAIGSNGKFLSKKLGSFSKTNPIWRLFMTDFWSIYAIDDGF